MSIKVMNAVWEHSKQKGSALLLLLAIADFAHDDGGGAYPSLNTLAAKLRMTQRNVQFLVATVEKSGEMVVERDAGPHGCNLYTICLASLGKSFREEKFSSRKNASPLDEKQRKNMTKSPAYKPSIEPSVKPLLSTDSEQGKPAPSQETKTVIIPPASEATSALGYFLAVSKETNGRTATLPNAEAAGSQAKRLAAKIGKDDFQSAVNLFFRDEWCRANYGASWAKFYQNFETILAKATVPQPLPASRQMAAPPAKATMYAEFREDLD